MSRLDIALTWRTLSGYFGPPRSRRPDAPCSPRLRREGEERNMPTLTHVSGTVFCQHCVVLLGDVPAQTRSCPSMLPLHCFLEQHL